MQLTDSNFPSGAFSHSFGLETFIQDGTVQDAASFQRFIEAYVLEQLTYTDGLAVRLVYEALNSEVFERVEEIDQLLTVSTAATESRLAAQRIGQQMLRICRQLFPHPWLERYAESIKEKRCYGQTAIVQALVMFASHIDKELACETVMFGSASSLIQNAVRGIPLGQTDGQKAIQSVYKLFPQAMEKIQTLTIEDLGCKAPCLEIKQMQHEHLHVRLFMS